MLNKKFYLLIIFSGMLLNITFGQQNQSKVLLKNGDVLSGVIISQNQFNLLLKTQYGNIEIKTENIKNISYTDDDIGIQGKTNEELLLLQLQQKSPGISAGLSFLLPGLGQYYVGGETQTYVRGVFYTASYITGVVFILVELPLAGVIISSSSSVISSIDALISANARNKKLMKNKVAKEKTPN